MSEPNSIVYVKRDADEGTPVPVLWMLIEYRTRNRMKNYEVVAAKDVSGSGVGGSRSSIGLESMHTGKLINVKKDTGMVQATIVTISDDKTFLNNELKDLLQMEKEEYEVHGNKKRKRFTPKVDNIATQSSSTTSSSYARWNTKNSHEQSSNTIEHQNGGATMNKQSVIKSNPNVHSYPPMTFDQQTQTDFKANADLTSTEMRFNKILTVQEDILRDVHTVTEDNHNIKQQVASLRVEVAEIKTLLKGISEKLTHQNDGVHSTSTDFNRSSSSILNSTQSSTVLVPTTRTPINANPPRILNLSHQSNYTPLNYNSISIEPVSIEVSNDSNFSYSNHSRMSLSASNQSIYQADTNHNDSATNLSGMKHEYSSSNNTSKNADSFADEVGDPNEEVILGTNGTTVARSVLVNINWNSHTAATRRLLRAKFSREILATHSLTGKPSPGMCATVILFLSSSFFIFRFTSLVLSCLRLSSHIV